MYDKICNGCRTRLSQFYKTGYLGCPECYVAFEKEITMALKNIQGKTVHVGKEPSISAEDKALLNRYRTLLSKKEIAGLEGRFGDMADLSIEANDVLDELRRRGLM
ncbi:MAG: hypothetical protein E7369_03475 [Clostridiales bacterium]|nr:hypothetical protein [Clostridiales bacterium]